MGSKFQWHLALAPRTSSHIQYLLDTRASHFICFCANLHCPKTCCIELFLYLNIKTRKPFAWSRKNIALKSIECIFTWRSSIYSCFYAQETTNQTPSIYIKRGSGWRPDVRSIGRCREDAWMPRPSRTGTEERHRKTTCPVPARKTEEKNEKITHCP
jgi:hypothetical protein